MSAIDTMPAGAMRRRGTVAFFFGTIIKAIWTGFAARREMQRTRLHLFELSDAELVDIGLTREVAEREASRSLLACYLNHSR